MIQTLSRDWGAIRDVQYEQAWVRYVTVGLPGSYFSVCITDLASPVESIWSKMYDSDLAMSVGFAMGDTIHTSLAPLLRTSHPDDTQPPVNPKALYMAARTYRVQLMQALDIAALYRNKPKMVMWAHNGAAKPQRLDQLARSWGFTNADVVDGYPIYERVIEYGGVIDGGRLTE